jgi:hypothetical protein
MVGLAGRVRTGDEGTGVECRGVGAGMEWIGAKGSEVTGLAGVERLG